MKKFIFALACLCSMPFLAFNQHAVKGKVSDMSTGTPLPGAHVKVINSHIIVFTDNEGNFEIKNIPANTYNISCSYIGYTTYNTTFSTNDKKELIIQLSPSPSLTEEVIISATRSDIRNPVTQTTINRKDIESLNLGQDMPTLLKTTPSVVVTSDAGHGIGYSGINIRGSDPTRINITINGIPANDSESHGVWWVNMPDFAGSVENIQIQRGVGTSTNGAAAFGASINLRTNTLNEEKYAVLSASAGSFNTVKSSLNFGTGLLPSRWAFDGRVSTIQSKGYIDRASVNLSSYYLSGGYYGEKNIIKLIHFSGREKTYQAWYGVPKDSLETNRTFNPAGLYTDSTGSIKFYDNETDNYRQDHYQIHYSHQFNRHINVNTAFHLTRGKGYYEQYRDNDDFASYKLPDFVFGSDTATNTDIIRRRWLDNYFYGATYALHYNSFNNFNLIAGGAVNAYDGSHFGDIIWAELAQHIPLNKKYYENNAFKKDINNYIKATYTLKKLSFFGDLQLRSISYDFTGKAIVNNAIEDMPQNARFNFINPKLGINWMLDAHNNIYGYWGVANREPVRDDFTESTADSRPGHETMNNIELGYKRNRNAYALAANVYFMDYKNQLVLTGEINDVGNYTRRNIDKSYRAGIELEGSLSINKYLSIAANLTFSRNKIPSYTEYFDVYDANFEWTGTSQITYTNTNISFSPDIIAGGLCRITPLKNLRIDYYSKYVGKQYIDNTSDKNRMLNPYYSGDLNIAYTLPLKFVKAVEFIAMVNNISNTSYITNAWVYNGIVDGSAPTALADGYFPQAGRHFLAGINIRF